MHLKILSVTKQPFCLGLNIFNTEWQPIWPQWPLVTYSPSRGPNFKVGQRTTECHKLLWNLFINTLYWFIFVYSYFDALLQVSDSEILPVMVTSSDPLCSVYRAGQRQSYNKTKNIYKYIHIYMISDSKQNNTKGMGSSIKCEAYSLYSKLTFF